MPWPLSQDYNEAVQDPQTSFADPELRAGQPAVNALGLPLPRSGNFADVYEFRCQGGSRWAVKCFTREVPGLRERYHEISRHLTQAKLPFTVDFTYLEQGIRVAGTWYPVLKMQWVEGLLLNNFVRDNAGKPALLDALGQIWVRMARRLREARVAHCNLQHGNVILVPGSKATALALKLIDYDGMFVPALGGKKSGEVGHPAYQHPQRLREGTYGPQVDHLPLLAILCALRAAAVGGRALWDRFDNGDNLLFRETDLRRPAESALFRELWNLPDAVAHDLVGHLTLALQRPIEQVPPLEDFATEDTVAPLTARQEEAVVGLLGPGFRPARPAPLTQRVRAGAPAVASAGARTAVAAAPVVAPAAGEDIGTALGEILSREDSLVVRRRSRRTARKSALPWVIGGVAGFFVAAGIVLVASGVFGSRHRPEPHSLPKGGGDLAEGRGGKKPPPQGENPEKPDPVEGGNGPQFVPVRNAGTWVQLFNGKDLTGWTKNPGNRGDWHVENGVLVCDPAQDFDRLFSDRGNFGNFRCRIEARVEDRGIGGQLFRAQPWEQEGYPGGYYTQTNNTHPSADRTGSFFRVDPGARSGQLLQRVSSVPAVPEDWFVQEVTAEGNHLTVKVNGQTVADVVDGNATYRRGHLCLCASTGGKIEYRKIEIQELPGTPAGAENQPPKQVVKVPRGVELQVIDYGLHPAPVRRLALSPNGRLVLSACDDGLLRLFEVSTGRPLRELRGHQGPVNAVAFCPDGKRAVSGGADLTVRLWDLETGEEMRRLDGQGDVRSVAVSPTRDLAVFGGLATVSVWDLKSPKPTIYKPELRGTACVAFTPKGDAFLTGAFNGGLLQLWDAATGERIRSFEGHQGAVHSVAVSPDGKYLLSGGEDRTVRFWDLESGAQVRTFSGMKGTVYAVAFSRDGSRALAVGQDPWIHLWWTATGQEFSPVPGHGGAPVLDAAFDRSGQAVFSASGDPDHTLRRRRLPRRDQVASTLPRPQKSPPLVPGEPLPVPNELALNVARAKILADHTADYADARPSARMQLGITLQQEAGTTNDDPVRRFALLREAHNACAEGGQVELALRMAEALGKLYSINVLEEKAEVLERAGSFARFFPAQQQVAQSALALAEEAQAAKAYPLAERVLKTAEIAARGARRKDLEATARQQLALLEDSRKEDKALFEATQTLAGNPADPAANVAVGKYRCFRKGEWDLGLPLLIKGNDPALAKLAKKDLDGEKQPAAKQAKVGDDWFAYADKASGATQLGVRKRAHHWYQLALPGLKAQEVSRVQGKLQQLSLLVPELEGGWERFNISQAEVMPSFFRLRPGRSLSTKEPLSGPVEITAVARTEQNNIRLHAGRGGELIFNWELKPGELRVHRPDSGDSRRLGGLANPRQGLRVPLQPNRWYHLRWRLTEKGMEVAVDGYVVFREGWPFLLASAEPVRLFATDSVVDVKEFTVTPLR